MRILGIDYGTKRIGIAVTDPLGLGAQPLKVIENGPKTFDELKDLIAEYSIGKIIVGLPKNMDGSIGLSAENVLSFVEKLKRTFDVPLETYDERLSTSEAQKTLINHDMKRADRKKTVDKLAAAYMLQAYISRNGGR